MLYINFPLTRLQGAGMFIGLSRYEGLPAARFAGLEIDRQKMGRRNRILKGMKVRVCYHNQCFDGAASAAVFSRLFLEKISQKAEFHYTGLAHRAGQLFDEGLLDSNENAIVDFKYSSSPQLTWWFDHHQSAFLTEADAEHFKKSKGGRKFYNPQFPSCAGLIADVGKSQFGFQIDVLKELLYWANIIDGAQYPDAKSPVEMKDPAIRLGLVIEASRSEKVIPELIRELTFRPLCEVATLPHVEESFYQLFEEHQKALEILRARAVLDSSVVYFDISGEDLDTYSKFIPYYLFPQAVYCVGVSASKDRAKIAVGTNPWNSACHTRNLASICERHGGGGHAKVAAISLPPAEGIQARRLGQEIAELLRRDFP